MAELIGKVLIMVGFNLLIAAVSIAVAKLCSTGDPPPKKPPLTKEQIYNIAHAKDRKEAQRLTKEYRGRWF